MNILGTTSISWNDNDHRHLWIVSIDEVSRRELSVREREREINDKQCITESQTIRKREVFLLPLVTVNKNAIFSGSDENLESYSNNKKTKRNYVVWFNLYVDDIAEFQYQFTIDIVLIKFMRLERNYFLSWWHTHADGFFITNFIVLCQLFFFFSTRISPSSMVSSLPSSHIILEDWNCSILSSTFFPSKLGFHL